MAISDFLSNTLISVISLSSSKDGKGGKTNQETIIYLSVKARIEIVDFTTNKDGTEPLVLDGKEYKKVYLMHTWKDDDGVLYDIQPNHIIEDQTSHKRYRVADVAVGALFKDPAYKLESRLIVWGDERYPSFSDHV